MSQTAVPYDRVVVDATAGAKALVELASPQTRVGVVNYRLQTGAGNVVLHVGRGGAALLVRQGNRLHSQHRKPIDAGVYADVPAGVVAEFLVVYHEADGDGPAFDVIDT